MRWSVVGYLAIPIATTIAGGVLSAFFRPKGKLQSHIQHFAAGVVLAAVAVEVLPELERERQSAWPALVAFAFGSVLMFALKWGEHRRGHVQRRRASGAGMTVASAADILVDGVVVGAGLAVGRATGLLLAIGLSIELLFLGVSIGGAFGGANARWKALGTTIGLALVLCVGAAGGYFVLHALPAVWTRAALAFGSAAMLFLVTEELLVEAHASSDSPFSVAYMFAGFLSFWILRVIQRA